MITNVMQFHIGTSPLLVIAHGNTDQLPTLTGAIQGDIQHLSSSLQYLTIFFMRCSGTTLTISLLLPIQRSLRYSEVHIGALVHADITNTWDTTDHGENVFHCLKMNALNQKLVSRSIPGK